MDVESHSQQCTEIIDTVASAVITDRSVLETILVGMLSNGHILLEDVPGTGKTLTARTFGDVVGLSTARIQFTPDLLPADVIGSTIYNEETGSFEFQPGPIFAHIVLADEINRAPPKTQAALLEAMEEGQVTVSGETHDLPDPFIVIATQNPVEMDGTFELPAAQKDRFIIKTSLGYPDRSGSRELLDRRDTRDTKMPTAEQVCLPAEIQELRATPEGIVVKPAVREYLVDVCHATREVDRAATGVSPRGVQRFFEAVRAYAALSGRSYVTPDDIKQLAPAVLAHRIVLTPDARAAGDSADNLIEQVLSSVSVPQLTTQV